MMSNTHLDFEDPTQRLLKDLLATPSVPQGPHLLTEMFIEYANNTLPEQMVNQVNNHLASCWECAARMEWFLDTAEAWEGSEGSKRLASLEKRILAAQNQPPGTGLDFSRLFDWLAGMKRSLTGVSLGYTGATTARKEERGEDHDERWLAWEDESGNLHISLELNEPALEGMAVRFQAGSWQQDVILRRTADAPDSLSASVMVPAADRRNLPEDASLTYVIIPAMS